MYEKFKIVGHYEDGIIVESYKTEEECRKEGFQHRFNVNRFTLKNIGKEVAMEQLDITEEKYNELISGE